MRPRKSDVDYQNTADALCSGRGALVVVMAMYHHTMMVHTVATSLGITVWWYSTMAASALQEGRSWLLVPRPLAGEMHGALCSAGPPFTHAHRVPALPGWRSQCK